MMRMPLTKSTSPALYSAAPTIMEAEAEAESILRVQQATADALRILNEAAPNDQVIKLKALEAFAAAANGIATKIIIPSEIQSLAGLAAGVQTLTEQDHP